ncbi:V-set and immunoglobulin domain-containing protein 10-like, partial [Mustelus asterias]
RAQGVTVEAVAGTVSVRVGDSATLAVTHSGSAAPYISWEHGVVLVTWSPSGDLRILPEYEGRLIFSNLSGTIRIHNVTLEDSGRYTVKMEALGGPASEAEVTLKVYVPIQKVAVRASTETVIEGQDGLTLTCEVAVGTRNLVEWQKDGGKVGNGTRHVTLGDSLRIQPISRNDTGMYTCLASNPISDGMDSYNLTVSYGPSDQEVRVNGMEVSVPQVVRGSSRVRLECRALSAPVTYIWTCGEKFWNEQNVELSNVTEGQAGSYKCSVYNEKTGRTISQEITIHVYNSIEEVRLSSSPEGVTEGDLLALLTCEILRGSWVSVDWAKDGHNLTGSDRHNATLNTLEIAMVTRNDSGLYTCTAHNPLGSGNGSFALTVFYGPENAGIRMHADSGHRTDYLVVNSSVDLACSANSVPPALYHWARQQDGARERPIGNGSSLRLSAIQVEHSDRYTCTSCNAKTGKCLNVSIPVTVYEVPKGRPECSVLAMANDSGLQFSCSWLGGFPKAVIHWIGLSRIVNTSSQLAQNESSPTQLNGRTLTCIAMHPLGTTSCHTTPLAPSVTPSRRVARETQGDATVTLRCEVRSNPPSAIHWFKGQRELKSGGKISVSRNSSEILIRDFSALNDTGNYSCSCRNPLGEERPFIVLTAPVVANISVVRSVDGETANVSWKFPESAVVTSFLVEALQGSEGRDWKRVLEVGTERQWAVVSVRAAWTLTLRMVPMLGSAMGTPSPICVSPSTAHGLGLSAGTLAGIVVGCVAGVSLISLLPICICVALRR